MARALEGQAHKNFPHPVDGAFSLTIKLIFPPHLEHYLLWLIHSTISFWSFTALQRPATEPARCCIQGRISFAVRNVEGKVLFAQPATANLSHVTMAVLSSPNGVCNVNSRKQPATAREVHASMAKSPSINFNRVESTLRTYSHCKHNLLHPWPYQLPQIRCPRNKCLFLCCNASALLLLGNPQTLQLGVPPDSLPLRHSKLAQKHMQSWEH